MPNAKPKRRLTNIKPREVSMVDNAANERQFIVVKSKDGNVDTDGKPVLKRLEVAVHSISFWKGKFASIEDCKEFLKGQGINPDELMAKENEYEYVFKVNDDSLFEGSSLGFGSTVLFGAGVDGVVGVLKNADEAKNKDIKKDEDAKPEGEAAPEGEAKPEGDAAPEGEAKPEGEAAPEGDAKPEEDAKPENKEEDVQKKGAKISTARKQVIQDAVAALSKLLEDLEDSDTQKKDVSKDEGDAEAKPEGDAKPEGEAAPEAAPEGDAKPEGDADAKPEEDKGESEDSNENEKPETDVAKAVAEIKKMLSDKDEEMKVLKAKLEKIENEPAAPNSGASDGNTEVKKEKSFWAGVL